MADDAQLTARLEIKVNEALRQMDRFNNRFDVGLNRFERRAREASNRVNASLSRIGLGSGMAKGLLAGAAGAFSVQGAQALLDTSTRIQNSLKTAGLEGDKLAAVYERLFRSAQKNAVPLEAMAGLYGNLARAQKELGVSDDQLLSFTDKIGVALRVSGKSAEEASGALMQLGQALGGGASAAVRAEEFNSILEGAPTILQAAAAGIKDAGGSVSKLRNLMLEGKLSAGALFQGFIVGSAEMEKRASSSEMTISGAFVRLQNVLIDVAGDLNKGTGATNKLAGALEGLGHWIESTDWQPMIDGATEFAGAIVQAVSEIEDLARKTGELLGTDQVGKYLKRKYAERQEQGAIGGRIDGAFGNNVAPKGDRLKPGESAEKPADTSTKPADENKPKGTTSDPVTVEVKGGRVRGGYVDLEDYPVTGGKSGEGETGATDAAFKLIAAMERFRSDAYPDYTIRGGKKVNSGYRAGYGSGTYTDDAGNAVKVTSSTSVTVKQATDDLNRRIGLYFSAISNAVGPETFAALDSDQQAVLASLAHNYGTLPDRIVAAVKTGDPRTAYDAIVRLGSDNGGINKGRRQDEADQYLNGAPAYVRKKISEDEQATEQAAKKLDDQKKAYDELVQSGNAFISEQEAERAAIGLSAEAAAKLRIQQELLNDAKARDIELTPARIAGFEQQAAAMAKAETATKQARMTQEELADAQSFAYDEIGNGLIDVITGAQSAEEALQGLLKTLVKASLQAAIMGQGPLAGIFGTAKTGGLLGMILGAPIKAATGGRIRGPGTGTSDSIPAMLSNGEHVTNARSARKYGALLDMINADRVPHFAAGTPVMPRNLITSLPKLNSAAMSPQRTHVTVGLRKEGLNIYPEVLKVSQQTVTKASPAIVGQAVASSDKRAAGNVAKHQAERAGAEWRLL